MPAWPPACRRRAAPPEPEADAAFWGPEPGPLADAGVDPGAAVGASVGEAYDGPAPWADSRTSVFDAAEPPPGAATGEALTTGFDPDGELAAAPSWRSPAWGTSPTGPTRPSAR